MKILLSTFYNNTKLFPLRVSNPSCENTKVQYDNLKPLKCDTISFGNSARNAETLRKLMLYKVPCIYSGKIVIAPKILEQMMEKKIFSSSLRHIIKVLSPFENSFHDVEKEVFEKLKTQAMLSSDIKLDEAIKKLANIHDKRLRRIQQPIFDNLNSLAQNLPKEQLDKYNKLMEVINKKLDKEPVESAFSAREFRYKLFRINDEIIAKNQKKESHVLRKIIQLSYDMPEKTYWEVSGDINSITSKAKKNKKIKNKRELTLKRRDLLNKMVKIARENQLQNNQELEKLFSQTRGKIFGIPITIPFNRKSFIYEIKKIVADIEDTKLANKMVQVATQLPKSHDDVSAFIVKASANSSEKIAYDLLSGSTGSIEHLIPSKKQGNDSIENYAITTAYYNSERGHRDMSQQFKSHPETYKNCQKYVDRLIELYNDGIFEEIGLNKWYIINFVKKMYKLSPSDKKLILDISKLKD